MRGSTWMAVRAGVQSRRWRAVVATTLLLVAFDAEASSFGSGDPASREQLLQRLLELSVDLDQLKPVLVALQGRSFQPTRIDQVQRHVGLVVGRLRAGVDDAYSAAVGVNLAGLAYDVIRLDAEATARRIGGVVHNTCSVAFQQLWWAMDAYAADPAWAAEDRAEAVELIERVVGLRDNAMAVSPWANTMIAGTTAASMTTAAVSLTLVREQGAALARLALAMGDAGASSARLAVQGAGASVGIRAIVVGGGAVALTGAEVAALVRAGMLSVTSVNLMMAVAGKGKDFDQKVFAEWGKRLPRKKVAIVKPALEYQVKLCGPEEVEVYNDGKEKGWVDGLNYENGHLVDAKHVGDLERSPFIEGTKLPDDVRAIIRSKQLDEIRKYGSVVLDPTKPPVGLELRVSDARAVPYFEHLLREAGVPGRVVVRPP